MTVSGEQEQAVSGDAAPGRVVDMRLAEPGVASVSSDQPPDWPGLMSAAQCVPGQRAAESTSASDFRHKYSDHVTVQ